MIEATVLRTGTLRVVDYRCRTGPHDAPYPEQHDAFSLSFVRRGSFGYRCEGVAHELVAGAVMLGRPGSEYVCTHEHHHHGDDCLSFQFSADALPAIGGAAEGWRAGALPPLADVVVLGELALAAAQGRCDVGLDEAGVLLAARCLSRMSDTPVRASHGRAVDRRRVVDVALWIDEHAHDPTLDLDRLAALAGLSPFHFLRLFSNALGVTPHQYVVRTRLRRAARWLADSARAITDVALASGFDDLSHFVRTFHRAAGVSPGVFRREARGRRRNLQDRGGRSAHDDLSL
ncbi:MAG: helix-turn-helix transcriptional regulator [Burkholderiales bacterium]